jgi:hypothetical protein
MAIGQDGSGYVDYFYQGDPLGADPVPGGFAIAVFDPTGRNETGVSGYPASDMTADPQGNLYLTGNDPSVVSTPGSLSGTNQSNNFIVKLNGQGQVVYAIHNYGGSYIAVDVIGDVFTVAADAYGTTPTPGAYQTSIPPELCNVVTINGPACTNSQTSQASTPPARRCSSRRISLQVEAKRRPESPSTLPATSMSQEQRAHRTIRHLPMPSNRSYRRRSQRPRAAL